MGLIPHVTAENLKGLGDAGELESIFSPLKGEAVVDEDNEDGGDEMEALGQSPLCLFEQAGFPSRQAQSKCI